MSDESIRSPHQVPPTERAGRWSDEERYRLSYLRNLHSHLSWPEFHKMTSSVPVDTPELNYFPNRSQLALYNEHLRMEKLNAKRRVQVPKDRSNASPLLRPKRPMLHDTSPSQARPDKQVRITIDDDESNDDDGDIQGDGETTRLRSYSHHRQEQSRPSDSPRKPSLGPSGRVHSGPGSPARQKCSPPSRPATKPSESPNKRSLGPLPAALKLQPAKVPSPTTSSATASPIMQIQPQNMGITAANSQAGPSAVPQISARREGSGTPGSEASNPINLSLPPRPATQSETTESAAIVSPEVATPTINANANTTSTATQQNKLPPAAQGNKPIPALETQLNSTPYQASTTSQCMMSQAQWLIRGAQFNEQENKIRAEAERRLAFHIAAASKAAETKIDELRERIEAQGKILDSQAGVIDSQQKEIQLLKAEREDSAWREEIDDLKNSGSEQLAALAKQIEGLKEDTQKVIKFQGSLHRALNDNTVAT